MYILGISCFYHDSAACLLRDGTLVAACQEERFSRIKHDWQFPVASIQYCLLEAGISIDAVDYVSYYEKPFLKFERVLETFLATAPRGYRAYVDMVPSWLHQKIRIPQVLKKTAGYRKKLVYSDHHLSHAASAYFTSSFDECAILTVDGVGEWATAAYGTGRGNKITLTHELRFPDSLGLLYSAITSYLGFQVNGDEYKVMGMAPYGKPDYADALLKNVVTLRLDGSLELNLDYFSFQYGRRMCNEQKLAGLLSILPRRSGDEIRPEHFNLAASVQRIIETGILRMAEHVHRRTKTRNLCLAGGVALNSVANGRLLREGPFDDIFIQPAAGDAGAAVGAAYVAYHHYAGGQERQALNSAYLGPAYSSEDILGALSGHDYRELPETDMPDAIARLLAEGKVVGWFQGRMEFGPRALGNRSILADPRRTDMKDIINKRVKFRESFRPFAPAVPAEDASKYFCLNRPSPFMLLTVPVASNRIPAVTHIDGSARVQTVTEQTNKKFHQLLRCFERYSGIPVLLNTSLNIKGEPIALSPRDALRCYRESGMDALALGNCLLVK